MANLTRRGFIAATMATGALRGIGIVASKPRARHVVTLVYDKALGAMRIIDRAVP